MMGNIIRLTATTFEWGFIHHLLLLVNCFNSNNAFFNTRIEHVMGGFRKGREVNGSGTNCVCRVEPRLPARHLTRPDHCNSHSHRGGFVICRLLEPSFCLLNQINCSPRTMVYPLSSSFDGDVEAPDQSL